MSSNPEFDRWYAARQTRILLAPENRLETFGNTLVNYHLLSVLDDYPNKVRIREGRLEAHQPLVIAPHFSPIETSGFSDEARAYAEWLRAHEEHLRILRYGYSLKSDNFSEQVVTDSLAAVTERVLAEVRAKEDPLAAVVQGVDSPWDVALVRLWSEQVDRSAKTNLKELQEKGKLF